MEGLLWLLMWAAFFYFMMRFGCGSHMVHGHGRHGTGGHGSHGPGDDGDAQYRVSATDPVCGMEVAPDSGYGRTYKGREYRFCSRQCLDQFDNNPGLYAN